MKKQTLVATLGTLALLANVLLPGLAFGQTQTGTADIGCNGSSPTTSITPNPSLGFFSDGVSTDPLRQAAVGYAFTDDNGNDLDTTDTTGRFISVDDDRDVRGPADCANTGYELTLAIQAETDGDFKLFETDRTAANGVTDTTIPTTGLRFLTSNDACPAGWFEDSNGVCYAADAYCNDDDDLCSASGANTATATFNVEGNTAFETFATYPVGSVLGSGTPGTDEAPVAALTILDTATAAGAEVYNEAGVSVAYATEIPSYQAPGSYSVIFVYSV